MNEYVEAAKKKNLAKWWAEEISLRIQSYASDARVRGYREWPAAWNENLDALRAQRDAELDALPDDEHQHLTIDDTRRNRRHRVDSVGT